MTTTGKNNEELLGHLFLDQEVEEQATDEPEDGTHCEEWEDEERDEILAKKEIKPTGSESHQYVGRTAHMNRSPMFWLDKNEELLRNEQLMFRA